MNTTELNNTIIFFENNYKNVVLNLFQKEQRKQNILKFGYICPGATKTLEYLNNFIDNKDIKLLYNKIRRLTDALLYHLIGKNFFKGILSSIFSH